MSQVTEDTLYRGFAGPVEPLDESFLQSLASQYAASLFQVLLERHGEHLTEAGPEAAGLLAALAGIEPPFEAIWSPALGRCAKAAAGTDAGMATRAMAEVLVHAAAGGLRGEWEIQLAKPASFVWSSWLLPACDRLTLQSDGESATLNGAGGDSRWEAVFSSGPDNRWTGSGATPLPTVSGARGPIVLLSQQSVTFDYFGHFGFSLAPEITSAETEPLGEALALLRGRIPQYYEWVSRLLRWLIIVKCPQEVIRSGSQEGMWGLIYVSDNHDPFSLAEMLIHEASHQYFFLLTRAGTAAEVQNGELFYSPFVNTMRPLDRVVMGYHAFANVYLFYRNCVEEGLGRRDICLERMSRTMKDLRQVEEYVTDRRWVTPIGAGLTEPLAGELRRESATTTY